MTSKNYKSILKYLLLIFAFILISEFPVLARRPFSRQKGCLSNIRVLKEAVEMYNMDHEIEIDTVLPGRDYEEFEKKLIKNHYLRDVLYHTENDCSYGFVNITGTGTFFCKRHGTVDSPSDGNPQLPYYDTSLELPFTYEYSQKEERRDQEIARKKRFSYMVEIGGVLLIAFLIVFEIIVSIVIKLKKQKQKQSE